MATRPRGARGRRRARRRRDEDGGRRSSPSPPRSLRGEEPRRARPGPCSSDTPPSGREKAWGGMGRRRRGGALLVRLRKARRRGPLLLRDHLCFPGAAPSVATCAGANSAMARAARNSSPRRRTEERERRSSSPPPSSRAPPAAPAPHAFSLPQQRRIGGAGAPAELSSAPRPSSSAAATASCAGLRPPPFSCARPVRLAIPPHLRPFALLLAGLRRAASSPPFCALCPTGEAHRTTARPMRVPSQPRSPPSPLGAGRAAPCMPCAALARADHVGSDVAVHVTSQRRSKTFWTSSDTLE